MTSWRFKSFKRPRLWIYRFLEISLNSTIYNLSIKNLLHLIVLNACRHCLISVNQALILCQKLHFLKLYQSFSITHYSQNSWSVLGYIFGQNFFRTHFLTRRLPQKSHCDLFSSLNIILKLSLFKQHFFEVTSQKRSMIVA